MSRFIFSYNSLSDLLFSLLYLSVWICPSLYEPKITGLLGLNMILEFLFIHSTPFFNSVLNKKSGIFANAAKFGCLMAFYLMFAVALSIIAKSAAFVIVFLLFHLKTFVPVIARKKEAVPEEDWADGWALSTVLFLVTCILTSFLPIPAFGMKNMTLGTGGSGLWEEEPHRVIAFGFLYFALTAYFELRHEQRRSRRTVKENPVR